MTDETENRRDVTERFEEKVEDGDLVKISFKPNKKTVISCGDLRRFCLAGFVGRSLDIPRLYYLGMSNKSSHFYRSGNFVLDKVAFFKEGIFQSGAHIYEMDDFQISEKYRGGSK
ncbi:MAG: hypothetical protein KJ718_04090 [Nanoarchaeota archaeon]|nr:hypothetical protein [Nanoarchaeota archaeon]MBU1051709.1 hypothetical protein [Nanoarchaeota archaeon]